MPSLWDGPVPERREEPRLIALPVPGPHTYRLHFDDRDPVEVTADDATAAVAARPAGAPMPHTMSDLTEARAWFSRLSHNRPLPLRGLDTP